ncbi:MAG: cobalamin biosynthesis protein [Burkholderiales bacterium]|jgi:cobalamin biosynthesis protein CobD/CbiB|nr:cobalamin biosynthesis protein [Burkholderiales bacterium]
MKLLAIIVALGLEQWRAAGWRRALENLYVRFLRRLEVLFSTRPNTWLATIAALSPVILVFIIDTITGLAWWAYPVWCVLLLYFLMGFRHFSHAITEINENLQAGDIPAARQSLYRWQGGDCATLTSDQIAKRAIETGLIAAYRNVFGVFFWFCILGGAGAAFYWMLNLISREWARPMSGENVSMPSALRAEMGRAARWLLFVLDFLPIRFLAFTFAIVGDFENTILQWRALSDEYAVFDNTSNENVLMAAAAGALRVSGWHPKPVDTGDDTQSTPNSADSPAGDDADAHPDFKEDTDSDLFTASLFTEEAAHGNVPISPSVLPCAIGMVWRALLFWLILVGLLTIAGFIGVGLL